MKRETIETLLNEKLAEGVEAKKIIDAIMAENGKDIESLKAENGKLEDKLQAAKDALKNFEGVDTDKLNSQIKDLEDQLKAKDKEYADKLEGMKFDQAIESAVAKANGKNAKAIRALLDIDTLRKSKDQTADIEKALEGLKESDAYLFKSEEPINNPTGPTGGTSDDGVDDLRAAMGLTE